MVKNMKVSIVVLILFTPFFLFAQPDNSFVDFRKQDNWLVSEKILCLNIIESYPELASVKIIFQKKSLKGLGQAQPKICSLIRKNENRTYIISLQQCANKPILCFGQLPDSAKIGLVAHELIHVLDYCSKSSVEIAMFGARYCVNRAFRRQVEFETDSLTIIGGRGNEVLCFLNFVTNSPYVSKQYLRRKEKFYMKQEDILRIMSSVIAN